MGASGGGADALADARRADRAREEVALPDVAAEAGEQIARDTVFDALGDHLQPKVMAELDPGAHECPALRIRAQAAHHPPIELHLIERERAQAPHGKIAAPEVVEGDPHAGPVEVAEGPLDPPRLADELALVELEREAGGG